MSLTSGSKFHFANAVVMVLVPNGEMTSSVAGVQAAKIESNTPHLRRKHRRAKSGSKIEANGDGNGMILWVSFVLYALVCFQTR